MATVQRLLLNRLAKLIDLRHQACSKIRLRSSWQMRLLLTLDLCRTSTHHFPCILLTKAIQMVSCHHINSSTNILLQCIPCTCSWIHICSHSHIWWLLSNRDIWCSKWLQRNKKWSTRFVRVKRDQRVKWQQLPLMMSKYKLILVKRSRQMAIRITRTTRLLKITVRKKNREIIS